MGMIVILSCFNTKIGPSIFYSFPKTQLDTEILERIYDVMDQPSKEEVLTQSLENVKSMNYFENVKSMNLYFESKNEMLMVPIILDQQISLEIEEKISILCTKFSERLQSNEEIFMAFYINDINYHNDVNKEKIKKNEQLIKDEIKELYLVIDRKFLLSRKREKIVFQFNDKIGEYQELKSEVGIPLYEVLDSDLILLFIDPIQSRIWFWQGRNTTTEMKFIATEIAYSIREKVLMGIEKKLRHLHDYGSWWFGIL
ncbi:MAG: hypothetical protein CEE43_10370 [Promethearchaeota archaeon Loki_b32]|nr:MAG: hypothetical protein CEE43_10370 [Candidatus Lokiarchaeota archaeon Loki_b32]